MRRPRASYANVMSTIAVILAMSGTAVAATQISGTTIKDRTVGHKKLVLNTLTGAEVRESTLGKVPNADKLDGNDSTAFVKGNARIYRTTRTLASDDVNTTQLYSWAGLGTLSVQCPSSGNYFWWYFHNTTTGVEHEVNEDSASGTGVAAFGGTKLAAGETAQDYVNSQTSGTVDGPFLDHFVVQRDDGSHAADVHIGGTTRPNDTDSCLFTVTATVN